MSLVKPSDDSPFYELNGRKEIRMSMVLGQMFEHWLLAWQKKLARQACFDSYPDWLELVETGKVDKAHKVARDALVEDTTARDLGSEVHGACEGLLRLRPGETEGFATPPEVSPFIQQFAEWLDAEPRSILHIEATIFGCGWAGTADLIWEDEDGNIVLTDYKTGRTGAHKQAMQIVGYGSGEFIANPDGSTSPMPHIDRYSILDLKPTAYKELVLRDDAVAPALAGFRGLVALHQFVNTKGIWS